MQGIAKMPVGNAPDRRVPPPGGARFYRCALQVNPHRYARTYRGQDTQDDDLSHAQKIVDAAVRLGIEVLAITDHNNVDGVAAFRSASINSPVQIFPGFELRSSGGVHLLCLYSTEGIMPRMREEKRRRQFIFSTHNANIPVLGDAELIVGLSAAGETESGQARVATEHTGSIDSPSVREFVEKILEGSGKAFEMRRQK